MSADEVEEQPPASPGEEQADGMSDRAARAVLGAVGLMAAWGVIAAVPEAAYFVAGLGASACCRKGRAWIDRRRATADGEAEEPVDIAAHLRGLSGGEQHVLLTRLQKAAGLPDTKAVRQLLDEAGIRVRTGVRAGGKNGPGVHLDDIPAPSPTSSGPSSECCSCRSEAANANTNNAPESGAREGLRVEPIGQAGTVVHDPAEAHRHQPVRTTT